MDKKIKIVASTLLMGSVFSAGSVESRAESHAEMEKCYGVVKPGMNDCSSKTEGHSCAGSGVNPNYNWIYMPKGFCEKLVNGSLTERVLDNGGEE